ncbi:MAG TPA: phosphatidylglycerol lysyltransferase domain-containing protein [Draconibacterium sp.]|nr:phosphatidylglycerol lysyltransferase domain-containing protein [Draconibacterium sp.]
MVKFFKSNKNSKSIWQISLAVLMLLMTIYFVKNEHLEVSQIKNTLQHANNFYLLLGLVVTGIYILFQGLLYVFSFKTVGLQVGIVDAIQLFLKRNLISVFLPAGGFSSLAFFTKPLTKKGIEPTDIYYGSYIYGFVALLSVVVVAIPVIIILMVKNRLTSAEFIPFLALLVLIVFLIYVAWSFFEQKFFYHLILRFNPKVSLVLDKISSTSVNRMHFVETLLISVVIEIIGIAHVYISMLALGFQPTILISFIAYIIMVMLLIMSPFLRGMGAIEVSMTYIFVKSGIPTAQAAAITLVFRFFEFWTPLIFGLGSFFFSRKNVLLRVLPVFIIFIAGLINIFSAITPALPSRIEILEKLLPRIAVSVSNFTVFFIGLLLIILAFYLLKGVKRAWRVTMFLLVLSAIGHIVKGIDYEEASVSVIAIISLIYTYRLYHVKSSPLLRANLWRIWLIALMALIVYAVGGTFFLEKSHMGIDYDFIDSVKASFQLVFLFDASQYIPKTNFGHFFIMSVYMLSGGLLLSAIYLSLRPIFDNDIQSNENEFSHARLLVQNYGKSALDYFKYYPDKLFFFNDDGFLAYKIHRNFAVVLELPVCETDEAVKNLLKEFETFVSDNGFRAFYYRVPESSTHWFRELNKKALFIGQEAILDMETFTLSGSKMHPIRNAINKAKKLGYTFHVYPPQIKDGMVQKLKQVSDDWLNKPGKTESIFSQGMFLPEVIKKTTILTIENPEEKVVAFLNVVPDYVPGEGTYDLIRITEDAPTGIIYFLLTEMFEYLRQNGITKVNLGMVAFAGMPEPKSMAERSMKFALDNLKQLNHFKGQYLFKEKFNPEWVRKYLIYDSEYDLINFPMILKGVSKA